MHNVPWTCNHLWGMLVQTFHNDTPWETTKSKTRLVDFYTALSLIRIREKTERHVMLQMTFPWIVRYLSVPLPCHLQNPRRLVNRKLR